MTVSRGALKSGPEFDFNDRLFRANPYPTYKYMRETHPVCQVKPDDMWAVSRASDVEYVLAHPELFSSTGIN